MTQRKKNIGYKRYGNSSNILRDNQVCNACAQKQTQTQTDNETSDCPQPFCVFIIKKYPSTSLIKNTPSKRSTPHLIRSTPLKELDFVPLDCPLLTEHAVMETEDLTQSD